MSIIKGIIPNSQQRWAGFDLDWTIIRPYKGKLHNGNTNFRILPHRIQRLRELAMQGYYILIITNQKPYGNHNINAINTLLNNFQVILQTAGITNVLICSATSRDMSNIYRKPNIGFITSITAISGPFLPGSFYCGDAAGRPTDFSDTDFAFARNASLQFYTPEQVFPMAQVPAQLVNLPQVMFITVGAPGSGKTTFSRYMAGMNFIHVESDALYSKFNKMQSMTIDAINNGRSVVIDATNPKSERRSEYISIAKSKNIPCYILHFLDAGEERNKLRPNPVPKVAYNSYWSHYEEPTEANSGVPVIEVYP